MSPDFNRLTGAFFASVTPALSVTFRLVKLSVTLAHDTILLKKKRASYANARLSSFDGTDQPPRRSLRLQLVTSTAAQPSGGAR
jgi:hypothetical protein